MFVTRFSVYENKSIHLNSHHIKITTVKKERCCSSTTCIFLVGLFIELEVIQSNLF